MNFCACILILQELKLISTHWIYAQNELQRMESMHKMNFRAWNIWTKWTSPHWIYGQNELQRMESMHKMNFSAWNLCTKWTLAHGINAKMNFTAWNLCTKWTSSNGINAQIELQHMEYSVCSKWILEHCIYALNDIHLIVTPILLERKKNRPIIRFRALSGL